MGGALFLGNTLLTAPGPLDKTKNIVIARGAGPATMAKVLQDEGVIEHDRLFRLALMIDPTPKPIKAGEYEIPAHISMQALVDLLQSGKVVQRRLTVTEGMTTAEVVELVRKTEALSGEITLDLKEGDLLPETYFYSRDDTRDGLLSRMKEAMDKTLDEAWRKRAAGLPLATSREALILASIIEKETAIPAERPRVAAVFINRLRRKMKLESDPTTIYRPDRRQGPVEPRPHARRPAVELALQHLHRRRPAARPDLQSGPRLDRGGDQSGAARPLALFRRRRPGRPRLRRQPLRAQSQRRALAADPARAPGAAAPDAVGRARPVVAACPGAPARAAAGAAVSHAGHSPGARCAGGRGVRHLLVPARQPVDARPVAAAHPGGAGRHRRRRLLIFGVRFLPGLLPELFGLAGVVVTALIARAVRQPAVGRLQPAGRRAQRTEVRTAFLQAWIDHGTGDVGGTVLSGRFSGRTLDSLSDAELRDLHVECSADADSLRVLEPYLDRRLGADWRNAASRRRDRRRAAHRHDARGGAGDAGAAEGASEDDIKAAHRRLIQRMHPDVGGSADLAARINRAKDVLLGG